MRSLNCLGQKQKKSKKQPAFINKPELSVIPYSRWHGIKIMRGGKLYLFEMNINNHPLSYGETKLGHVRMANTDTDEWVEMPRKFLEECRSDASLMSILNERVEDIERLRLSDDSASDADGVYYEPEPEVFEE